MNHTPVICFKTRKLTVKQEETDCSVALRSCGGRLEICICHNKVIMFTQCSGLARLLWDFKKLPFFALFHLLLTGHSNATHIGFAVPLAASQRALCVLLRCMTHINTK